MVPLEALFVFGFFVLLLIPYTVKIYDNWQRDRRQQQEQEGQDIQAHSVEIEVQDDGRYSVVE